MTDQKQNEIQQLVEQAVTHALQAQVPHLSSQIVRHVMQSLPAPSSAPAARGGEDPGALVHAVSNIHAGSTQKEILRALLDAGGGYCSRIALFVVKGGAASGWQARGFGDEESVKDFPLDLTAGPVAHTYQNRVATPGNVAEMGHRFIEQFSAPENEQILVLPLTLKEKVAALVYADGGDTGKLSSAALEVLVMATSAWLEVTSLRKQAAAKEDGAMATRVEAPAPPVQTVSSFSDPFAGHAPKHVPASPPAAPEPVTEVVEVVSAHAGAAAAPAAATDPWSGMSPEDADVHRKAQGRRHKDLYDRLKEDIDKSRGTFQKRYGNTAAASADYFHSELLRSLAEDDVSIMGSNFRR
jgi:hypothetical protein